MGLANSMFTALSGMNSNQISIDTIGDNIANVNTTAFKSSRANFENQFSLTLSQGTAPSETSGGTNPEQIGLGSVLGSIQRNFLAGAIETTGVPTDVAIDGSGFFVVEPEENKQAYTRDGGFMLNADNVLVTSDGFNVLGYGVNDDFNIVPGVLSELEIPLGSLSSVQATTEARMDGNLNANGVVASQGTILHSQVFESASGMLATESTLLTELYDPSSPGSPLFAEGDVISVTNAKKGARQLPQADFTVTATSTLRDYVSFLNNTLGINEDENAAGNASVRIGDGTAEGDGKIIIEGNVGEENALYIEQAGIRSTNSNFAMPFKFTEAQAANGESVYTSLVAYDSLGTPVQVKLTMTLESKSNSGNTWRFYAESGDDTDASPVLGDTGTITFDNNGRLIEVTNNAIQVNRADTGALDPLEITLDFAEVTGLTSEQSALVMTTQNGYGLGTLTSFSIGTDGVVTGAFSNGLTQPLGQLAIAIFTNPEGLVGGTDNLFYTGPNAGQPLITSPGVLGAGRTLGGAIELSNVDLTREFIGLITASTAFSASGRVLSTSNELLNELLVLAR